MTPLQSTFKQALRELPLIAILRGLTPAEAPAMGDTLVDAGFMRMPMRCALSPTGARLAAPDKGAPLILSP